jgi:hypothetical protein
MSTIEALESLKSSLGILYKVHSDGRVILDYDQNKSPKTDEIVRECRGLVLDTKNDWELVARGFRRFFNAGECRREDVKFDWSLPVQITHKEDGSFFLLYHHNGNWHVNTRFSFAEHNISDLPFTWTELFKLAFDFSKVELDTNLCYVFEMCSLYNKVVRTYDYPQVFLLSVFNGNIELTFDAVKHIASTLNLKVPFHRFVSDISEAQSYISTLAESDMTFEGVVLRDCMNNRLKLKSDLYLRLHRLNNNGNIAHTKNIVPLIMAGETEEVLIYFPELESIIKNIESRIKQIKSEIDNTWFCHRDEKSQKKFALAIQKSTKYTGPLFSAKKLGGHPLDYLTAEYVTKQLEE